MFKVEHAITIGSSQVSTTKTSALLEVDVHSTLAAPVNRCRIALAPNLDATVQPGDAVKVELGYDGDLSTVFTGTVARWEQGHYTCSGRPALEAEALSAFSGLISAHFNLLYEKQAAGDIVTDVLGRLKLSTGSIESGITFASYAFTERESVSRQLQRLARRCGFDFYADSEDKAVFKKYAPATTHSFDYGSTLLGFGQELSPPPFDGVEVYGESPSGQGQGEDASSWLTKKEVKGTSGKSSGSVLRVVDPAARNQNVARDLAQNLLEGYQAQARGRVTVLGAPAVRLGDAVKIAQLPMAAQNGTFRVTGVRHRLNGRRGFVTDIAWEKV